MYIPPEIIARINELDIEDVATKLGLDVIKHKALCFMHDDHTPSITFSKPKNIYKCWVCGRCGGPIKMVQDKERLSFQEACIWLALQFNIWRPQESNNQKSIARKIHKNRILHNDTNINVFDEELCNWLIGNAGLSDQAKHFLYFDRLFDEEVVQKLNIKSVSDSKLIINALMSRYGEERCLKSGLIRRGKYGHTFYFFTPCLLFPYYSQEGNIVGIQSRFLGTGKNVPRFQFLASRKTRLYNLPILNDLNQGDTLFISEGITDCVALLSAGLNAVAIPSATILPLEDLVLLKIYDLHMFPDHDEAGQQAYSELRHFFINHYSTVKAEKLPNYAKDYCDYYITTKQNSDK